MTMFGSQWFASPSSTYEIEKSLCLNSPDSPYLSKTFGSAGNQKTWTFSCWLKLSRMLTGDGNYGGLFRQGNHYIGFRKTAALGRAHVNVSGVWSGFGGAADTHYHRDATAWYHYVLTWDTTESTAADRIKIYVNNTLLTLVTEGGTLPSEDYDGVWMAASAHELFRASTSDAYIFDGYAAELVVCDGTAYTPSSFAETNDQGVWVPKKISGLSFGTNGFHLDFKDSSSLGNDVSGNDNDWTVNNLAAADQSTDTPTNNHCTWNSNFPNDSNIVLTEGNRNFSHTGGDQRSTIGTMFPRTGKWYFEVKIVSIGGSSPAGLVGISQADVISQFDPGDNRHDKTGISLGYRLGDGQTYFNSSTASFGDSLTTNDILGIAWDADNGKCYFAKNNTWQNSGDPTSGATGTGAFSTTLSSDGRAGGWGPTASNEASDVYAGRFAEAEWSYSPPTGYKAFCTASLEEPAPKDGSTNFQAALFTGTGSSRSVTNDGNSNMQPDMILLTSRSDAYNNGFFDAARGVQKELQLSATATETTLTAGISAFDSDGFSFNGTNYNTNTYTFVAWQWSAGNSGASNEVGGINTTTTYSDATAGISISTYEGTGSASTIGHGLGVAPTLIMVKNRDATDAWKVYHAGVATDPQTDYLVLNTNAAPVDDATVWNDTAPTSTVFSIGTHTDVNTSGESYVSYAFVEVDGFSKIGVFTGNASTDGPFIYTGFKPAWVMLKRTDSADNWVICDNKRSPSNPAALRLYPDTTNADISSTTLDFISAGFKMRASDGGVNGSGGTYAVVAFAESPFGGDGVAPATAR